jgi:CPA2 family monovalent cation:H+ antiporter-2
VRAGLPAAGGYLLAGLIIGPQHLIATSDETRFLAELGIIFLMFMVGLEFSLSAMIAARRDVFVAGSLKVGLSKGVAPLLSLSSASNLVYAAQQICRILVDAKRSGLSQLVRSIAAA